jgi:fructose-1,6-bisphosphatase/inositol monophosphatase family enzyme
MTTWDKNHVVRLILDAGGIAIKHFETPVREYKVDQSIVTQADREIEGMLAETWDKPEEGSYLIGEETLDTRSETYIEEGLRKTAWIIDPIDGTSSYANHFPMWGVSIAHAREGRITEGALYLPVGGELFISEGAEVYFGRVGVTDRDPCASLLPYTPAQAARADRGGIISIAQGFAKHGGFHGVNTVHATGCCVFSLVHLLLGDYLAYVADLKLWDLAAGAVLLEKLGYIARFEDGRPFTTAIDSVNYRLEPEAPRRWKARGKIIFARNEQAVTYVNECFTKR